MKTSCFGCPELVDLSTLADIRYKCRKGHKVSMESGIRADDITVFAEDCNE